MPGYLFFFFLLCDKRFPESKQDVMLRQRAFLKAFRLTETARACNVYTKFRISITTRRFTHSASSASPIMSVHQRLKNITPLDGSLTPLPSVQQLRPVEALGEESP